MSDFDRLIRRAQDNPWASEATFEGLSRAANTMSDELLETINILRQKFELPKLEREILNYASIVDDAIQEGLTDTSRKFQEIVSNMERDADPINAVGELMNMGANATGKMIRGSTDLTTKAFPKFGEMLKSIGIGTKGKNNWLATAVEFGAGMITGLTVIVKEQEKAARLFIDYGLIVSDIAKMTDMRGTLADVGMSMAELQPILAENKAVFARIGGDSFKGAQTFMTFAAEFEEANGDLADFGLTTQELAKRLAEEAKLLYGIGELDQLDNNRKKIISDNFMKSQAGVTAMAEATGVQRSELLKSRMAAREDINWRQSWARNQQYMMENFTEGQRKNSNESYEMLAIMFDQFLPDMAEQAKNLMIDTHKDMRINETARDNISDALYEQLTTISPQFAEQFLDIVEMPTKGDFSDEQAFAAFQNLIKTLQDSEIKKGNATSDNIHAANTAIVQANTLQKSFTEMTLEQFKALRNKAAAKAEDADKPIDAMDAVRKGFRNAMHTITPGFETMGAGVNVFTDSVNGVGDIFASLGIGYKNPKKQIQSQEKKRIKRVKEYDNDINGIREEINDLKKRKANPAWWESPERIQRAINAKENDIKRLEEERKYLAKNKITKKGQNVAKIMQQFKVEKKKAASQVEKQKQEVRTKNEEAPKEKNILEKMAERDKRDAEFAELLKGNFGSITNITETDEYKNASSIERAEMKVKHKESLKAKMLELSGGDSDKLWQMFQQVSDKEQIHTQAGQAWLGAGGDKSQERSQNLTSIASALHDLATSAEKEKTMMELYEKELSGDNADMKKQFSDDTFMASMNATGDSKNIQGWRAGKLEKEYLYWLREQDQSGNKDVKMTEENKQRLWEIENKGLLTETNSEQQELQQDLERMKKSTTELQNSKEGFFSGMFWDDEDEQKLQNDMRMLEDLVRKTNYNLKHVNTRDTADAN